MKVLLSFHYYRDTDLDRLCAAFPTPPQVFADSGAYSAKSVGADVQLDEYVAWLYRWRHLFATYVNLDVIGDERSTWDNQQEMEAQGLQPVPVFHGGGDWGYLDRYCAGHRYVALGGMVASDDRAVVRWLVQAFLRGRATGTVFHGFGQTNLRMLRTFPWYSVDSSAWGAGHRYGMLNLWDDELCRWVRCKLGDHRQVMRHAPLIRVHGGDPQAMTRPEFGLLGQRGKDRVDEYRAERAAVIGVNAAAWLRMEAWMRRHHGPVLLDGQPDGPLLYLADARGHEGGVENPDLATAERQAGPHLYLADGHADFLVDAATATEGTRM